MRKRRRWDPQDLITVRKTQITIPTLEDQKHNPPPVHVKERTVNLSLREKNLKNNQFVITNKKK
jgi:hypothetical protein